MHVHRLICLLLVLSCQAESRLVRLVYSADYSPFSGLVDERPAGIEIEIANEVFARRLGLAVQHQILPWARAQAMVESGSADGIFAVPTPARQLYTAVSKQPVIEWRVSMFVRKGDHRLDQVKTISELMPYRLAVQVGNGWAKSKLAGMQVEYVPTQTALPRMLIADRFDVVLEESHVMASMLKSDAHRAAIVELPQSLDRADIHFLLGVRSPLQDLLARFDAEIAKMRTDGSLARILTKY